jgi:peptidoglycan glycosyltransferase
MGRRIQWLGVGLMLCFALVIAQLVNIQVKEATALNKSPTNRRNHTKIFENLRGDILAANGTVLAESVRAPHGSGTYKYIRKYPTGSLFSQIVGYSSLLYGTTGIEYAYNAQLITHTQPKTTLNELLSPPPPTTDDVTLTVQPYLQALARTELADVVSPNKDGAVVVLDPRTGAVLAMYSSPSYDPTTLSNPTARVEERSRFLDFVAKDHEGFTAGNPIATFYPLPPGSTFKVVTTAAVYNLKPALSTFEFPEAGCLSLQPYGSDKSLCNDATTPEAATQCGGPIATMLPQSCDPGYAKLGITLGAQTLSTQAEDFGYNSKPPIDLNPNEVQASRFPTVKTFQPTRLGLAGLAYSAFGQQTVRATALQQAMVASAVADGGTLMTPHLMAAIHSSDGTLIDKYTPTVYRQSMTPAAATQVNKLMQTVVTRGTASGVGFTPAMDVAVKTGTGQTTLPTYSANTQDWMIGFAPAYDPQVAIAVVVPFQPATTSGAKVAGPIVKAMLTAALNPPPGQ